MIKVGVVGLGRIGGGVAQCLARAGLLGAVYDVRPNAAADLGISSLSIAHSPRELASMSDVVLVAVVDAAQARTALEGPEGLLAGAHAGLSIVILSTVGLDELAQLRSLCEVAGIPLIDCGVAGGPKAADNGIICLIGAEKADLDRVRPALEGFAREVVHMGAPGTGMAAKIARNAIVLGCLRAGYEGAALARRAGIDVPLLGRVFNAVEDAGIGPLMFLAREADPAADPKEADFRRTIEHLTLKDLVAAQELGDQLGIDLPLVRLTAETIEQVVGLEQ